MTNVLASEGGYQAFTLHAAEKDWLYFALAAGILSLLVALNLMRGVLAADQGTSVMREIAAAIQEGAQAFLKRQFPDIIETPVYVVRDTDKEGNLRTTTEYNGDCAPLGDGRTTIIETTQGRQICCGPRKGWNS